MTDAGNDVSIVVVPIPDHHVQPRAYLRGVSRRMSYQVLARKWRPRTFHELVGQEHVSRALVNALDQGRLHHAYLFTGTRGVGKTTLARAIAGLSAASWTGVSLRPRRARTMKATCDLSAAPLPTTACFTFRGAYS